MLMVSHAFALGLWAVIVTDVLQFVVLTVAVLIVVPLSFDKIGGIGNFIDNAPVDFFSLVNDKYTPGFMLAFGLYNLFFIAGNWAYVQRYTSVSTPKDAKKVGWLFGTLYLISPIIWMLPPMIYRVLNPELGELAEEGAYLLMCKEVMPVGMLGLMLGGMVFATSSSVNTTLNIAAGVLTNDVYKHFYPQTGDQQLVKVGKLATALLGVITILLALLVPKLGGIVEVVMSLAALTGGAMFLPPLWTLFSKRQTGATALLVTLTSLLVNAFFKFIAPTVLGIQLDRTSEMSLGVGFPILLLAGIEIYFALRHTEPTAYLAYQRILAAKPEVASADGDNTHGRKVIGKGVATTGALILGLSFLAAHGAILVGGMGFLVLLLGGWIYRD